MQFHYFWINFLETSHSFVYYPYDLIFEVLRLVSAVFGTAIAVQAINKSLPYGHLVPNKEKQLRESFQNDWPIIALPNSE